MTGYGQFCPVSKAAEVVCQRWTPLIVREIWLLVLPELRRNTTVRKVLDWLVSVTKHDGKILLGSALQANPNPAFPQDYLATE